MAVSVKQGMRVEVMGDGQTGTWYPALVVRIEDGSESLTIRYDKENGSEEVEEEEEEVVVPLSSVRPAQPHYLTKSSWQVGDTVDVREKGFWLRGVVVGRLPLNHLRVLFAVFFPGPLILKAFPPSSFRPAMEWRDMCWFTILWQEGIPHLQEILDNPSLINRIQFGRERKRGRGRPRKLPNKRQKQQPGSEIAKGSVEGENIDNNDAFQLDSAEREISMSNNDDNGSLEPVSAEKAISEDTTLNNAVYDEEFEDETGTKQKQICRKDGEIESFGARKEEKQGLEIPENKINEERIENEIHKNPMDDNDTLDPLSTEKRNSEDENIVGELQNQWESKQKTISQKDGETVTLNPPEDDKKSEIVCDLGKEEEYNLKNRNVHLLGDGNGAALQTAEIADAEETPTNVLSEVDSISHSDRSRFPSENSEVAAPALIGN